MEYRRRRRVKAAGDLAGGVFRALLLLAVFGAAAYLIFGTGLGARIKDTYADSLMGGCSGSGASPLPTVSTPLIQMTAEPAAAPTGETCKVSLPAMEIYLLSMGAFDSRETAELAAEALRAMGAADYVYYDGSLYHPIAAAYSEASSAESVRARLVSEGHECSVLPLSYSGAELLITADANRLVPIRTAFALAPDIPAQLEELSFELDSGSRDTAYCADVLTEIEANIAAARSGIAEAAGLNQVLYSVDGCLSDLLALICSAKQRTASLSDFSSALKTIRIEAAFRFSALLCGIGGAC